MESYLKWFSLQIEVSKLYPKGRIWPTAWFWKGSFIKGHLHSFGSVVVYNYLCTITTNCIGFSGDDLAHTHEIFTFDLSRQDLPLSDLSY